MVIYFLQQRKEPLLPTYLNQEVCILELELKYTTAIQYLVIGYFQMKVIY